MTIERISVGNRLNYRVMNVRKTKHPEVVHQKYIDKTWGQMEICHQDVMHNSSHFNLFSISVKLTNLTTCQFNDVEKCFLTDI